MPDGIPPGTSAELGRSGNPQHIESDSDRAQRHRKLGLFLIPVCRMGFLPCNRGSLGISSHHAHEVAWGRIHNQTKLNRYDHARVVELDPAGSNSQFALDKFREANRKKNAWVTH